MCTVSMQRVAEKHIGAVLRGRTLGCVDLVTGLTRDMNMLSRPSDIL